MDVFGGAPRVLGYPRPVMVKCGTAAVLKCQIGGDPQLDVIWERKNESILPEGRYRITQDGKVYSLYISGVTMEDAGQYICRAKNNIGETYAAATLKVEEEPQELQQTQPAPHPQQNEVKPHFLIKPLSLRVDRGEDAAFSCKLSGEPLPQVVWEKDGKQLNEIYESSHYHVGQQDGGWFQLKIFRTRAPDGGVYMCKAINKYGEAMTGAVLLVEPIPEQREGSKTNAKKFTVTEGKHAKFRCYVTGKPKPEIVWKKDGENIVPGRRFLIFEDREGYYTLKVLYCKQQDTGLYICAASNALGNTLSAVQLSVKGPPVRFKRALLDAEVRERDVAVLECEVPEESISTAWYLEDQRLQPGNKYNMEQKGTRRRLTIQNVGADDDGVYLCEMPDGGKTIAELAVKGTIVKKLPRRLEVMEGENAAFFVEVEQDDMDICWFKDGLQLQETHQTIIKSFGKTHILVFVNTSYQDSGTITFMAGRSTTSSKLRVKTARHCPPICPVSVQMNTDCLNGAILSWSASPNLQNSTKSVYVLERQEVGSQEWQRCLTTETATSAEVLGDSVPCEGDYRFRICCVNKYGRSGHVEFPKVVHLAPGPKIKTPLKNAVVTEGEDAVFSIELSANLIGTWFLNSQQLQDSGRFSITQSKNQHTLRLHQVPNVYDGAEITFIATGVRDSATLQIKGQEFSMSCFAAPEEKFLPMSEMDTKKTTEVGNPIVLYCEVSHPTANVQWFKDGQELHVEEGLNIQSDGNMRRIVIQSAEYFHSGVYTCQSNNDILTFNVNVEAPPVSFKEIMQEERQKSAMELDPVVLTCELSRPDEPAYWFKDGVAVLQSDNITIQSEGTMKRLIIRSAALPDAGMYTCQAGDQTMSFSVNIKGNSRNTETPVTIVDPKDDIHMERYVSEEVVLNCELSRSNGEAHWFKDGLKLQESENVRLSAEGPYRRVTILCASKLDSGEYVCDTGGDSIFFQLIITEAPVCIVSPRESEVDVCILSSEKLVLRCEISKADAEVCWFCDGMEIEENDILKLEDEGIYRRLVIPCATIDDSAEYVCETADDSVTFWVKVEEPPVKLSCSKETGSITESFAGEPVVLELECELSTANGVVNWYKNGSTIKENERFCFEEEGAFRTLVILCAELQDSGEYILDAKDDSISFHVTVQGKKCLSVSLVDTVAHKDGMVTLCCELCKAKADVQWKKDGVEIIPSRRFSIRANGTERSLTIHRLTKEDAGETCFVNSWLCNTTLLHLHTEAQVLFTKRMEAVMAEEFGEAVLETEVSLESGEVQWMRQGVVIQSGPRHKLTQNACKRILTITNLSLSDRGTYRCETLHDRTQVKLNVERKKIVIRKGLMDNETFERETASFEVEVSHADVEGVWQKDGLRVKPNNNWRVSCNGRVHGLTLSNLTLEDTGSIVFSAEGLRTTARLVVKETPVTIIKKLSDVRFEEESAVILECELSRPNVDVRWLKNGLELKSSKTLRMYSMGRKRCLQILECNISDSGLYTCEIGDLTCCLLETLRKCTLAIITGLEDLWIKEDQNAVFMCELSLEDMPGEWYKDGSRIRPTSTIKTRREGIKHFLLICNAKPEDSGEIKFVSKQVESIAYLEVEELPVSIVRPLRDRTALEKHRVILECTVSSTNCDVTWYKGDQELESTEHMEIIQEGCYHKLVIHQVALEDEGTYSIEVGEHSSTAKLMVEGEYGVNSTADYIYK
uniref:Obscurin-like protein 1 n=1 Tax=Sinocyclocheilus anshuiensis TaxID=1608454 RepID=A0A671LFM5_9TELE